MAALVTRLLRLGLHVSSAHWIRTAGRYGQIVGPTVAVTEPTARDGHRGLQTMTVGSRPPRVTVAENVGSQFLPLREKTFEPSTPALADRTAHTKGYRPRSLILRQPGDC